MCLDKLAKYKKHGLFFLRVALGALLFIHGYLKLSMGVPALAGFFAQANIPLAPFSAWFSALVELLGGGLLVLGLWTRLAALFVVIEWVAVLLIRWFLWKTPLISSQAAIGWEIDLLIFASALAMLLHGSDKWALENLFRKGKKGKK
jgi:putative oxidoreductase